MINVRYGKPKSLKASPQSIFVSFRYKQSIVNVIRSLAERTLNENIIAIINTPMAVNTAGKLVGNAVDNGYEYGVS